MKEGEGGKRLCLCEIMRTTEREREREKERERMTVRECMCVCVSENGMEKRK